MCYILNCTDWEFSPCPKNSDHLLNLKKTSHGAAALPNLSASHWNLFIIMQVPPFLAAISSSRVKGTQHQEMSQVPPMWMQY